METKKTATGISYDEISTEILKVFERAGAKYGDLMQILDYELPTLIAGISVQAPQRPEPKR